MGDRCTGHCCRDFELPYSPEKFIVDYARHLMGAPTKIQDIGKLGPMLIYKGVKRDKIGDAYRTLHAYTCKHLLPNGNCGNYENRPWMCSAYPYGKACTFKQCTWASAAEETAHERVSNANRTSR